MLAAASLAHLPGLRTAWRSRCEAAAHQPAPKPRQPLYWDGHEIGSVEPEVFAGLRPGLAGPARRGWSVPGDDLTASLDAIAHALLAAGRVPGWRNERLPVRDAQGRALGTVERGIVRLLGIPTQAVHLAAWREDGRFCVQQRSLGKATDPGLWDTLVGGMVPVGESVESALERETGEEAGLSLGQLREVVRGGCIRTQRPAQEVQHGWVIEDLHWYTGVLPDGVLPSNRDGEVAQFRDMPPAEVVWHLEAGEFTLDAALILLAAAG